jgi:mannose-6-phosphate isomerase
MPPLPLYPLRFNPIFKPAIWGGRRLADMFPGAPADGSIGEAWLLSDQGDNVSVVADGPLKGTTLRELMRDRREELLGPSLVHHETFPLLLKVIDARENLSVQVHPNDELAQKLTGVSRGKSEAWVVLHAEPGSRIYAGLKEGIDRAALECAVAAGTVVDCLRSFEPTVGNCIYLPAGTVHALGAGITVFEVQQTSDTTYRLFDWNRVDANTGQPRELHIEQVLACTNFDHVWSWPVYPVDEARISFTHCLVDCEHFSVRRTSRTTVDPLPAFPVCRALIPLTGRLTIRDRNGACGLVTNQIALIPAGEQLILEPQGAVSFLDIRPK